MSTICGHERETLQWALAHEKRCGGLGGFDAVARGDDHASAWRAIHDPTKLAKMIAAEAQRCGLTKWKDAHWPRIDLLPASEAYAVNDKVMVVVWWHWNRGGHKATLALVPQARTVLVALLQLADGAREQAERILRGESNG